MVSPAAALRTARPVLTSPVSEIMRTRSCEISGWPTSAPLPQTTLTTPGGSTSANTSASASRLSGVFSEGLMTRVLPAAMAGAIFQAAISSG
ncbi:hypothetical protein D9M73_40360 [compost metagenome]